LRSDSKGDGEEIGVPRLFLKVEEMMPMKEELK
jgi:hypothetical protein